MPATHNLDGSKAYNEQEGPPQPDATHDTQCSDHYGNHTANDEQRGSTRETSAAGEKG